MFWFHCSLSKELLSDLQAESILIQRVSGDQPYFFLHLHWTRWWVDWTCSECFSIFSIAPPVWFRIFSQQNLSNFRGIEWFSAFLCLDFQRRFLIYRVHLFVFRVVLWEWRVHGHRCTLFLIFNCFSQSKNPSFYYLLTVWAKKFRCFSFQSEASLPPWTDVFLFSLSLSLSGVERQVFPPHLSFQPGFLWTFEFEVQRLKPTHADFVGFEKFEDLRFLHILILFFLLEFL